MKRILIALVFSLLSVFEAFSKTGSGHRADILDVMFNSSLVYEIAVLKTYVEPLLAAVDRNEPEFSDAKRLYEFLGYFLPIEKDDIPINSIIREFIGGGCFYR